MPSTTKQEAKYKKIKFNQKLSTLLLYLGIAIIVVLFIWGFKFIFISNNEQFLLQEVHYIDDNNKEHVIIKDNILSSSDSTNYKYLNYDDILALINSEIKQEEKFKNIFSISLSNIKSLLEKQITVESAEVFRVIPNIVTLKIHEHKIYTNLFIRGNENKAYSITRDGFILPKRNTDNIDTVDIVFYYNIDIKEGDFLAGFAKQALDVLKNIKSNQKYTSLAGVTKIEVYYRVKEEPHKHYGIYLNFKAKDKVVKFKISLENKIDIPTQLDKCVKYMNYCRSQNLAIEYFDPVNSRSPSGN